MEINEILKSFRYWLKEEESQPENVINLDFKPKYGILYHKYRNMQSIDKQKMIDALSDQEKIELNKKLEKMMGLNP